MKQNVLFQVKHLPQTGRSSCRGRQSQHWSFPLRRWGQAAQNVAELTWRVAGWLCSAQTLWLFCALTGWPPQVGWLVERRWSRNSLDRRRWWTCRGMWSSPDLDPRTRSPPCKPEGGVGGVSVIWPMVQQTLLMHWPVEGFRLHST